jgi:hypothetical protein
MKGRKFTGEDSGNTLYTSLYGTSMNPTLSELDLLEVDPYREGPVQIGDVIFFNPPDTGQFVVHRVVRITPKGIQTCGDKCVSDDPWFLQSDNIKGRVVAAWRCQRRRRIMGGWKGWLVSHFMKRRRILDINLSNLLHPIYHSFSQRAVMQNLLPGRLRPRVVGFKADGSCYRRLLLGNLVVGRYDERSGKWRIKRPFRLFVTGTMLSETKYKSFCKAVTD